MPSESFALAPIPDRFAGRGTLSSISPCRARPSAESRGRRWGLTDLDRKYDLLALAHGDVMFAATGVTDGTMLKGVRRFHAGATTHSMVMRSKSGTSRQIDARHQLSKLSRYASIDYG